MPYVEDGSIMLVGETAEYPSFELNGALLTQLVERAVQLWDAALPLVEPRGRR